MACVIQGDNNDVISRDRESAAKMCILKKGELNSIDCNISNNYYYLVWLT